MGTQLKDVLQNLQILLTAGSSQQMEEGIVRALEMFKKHMHNLDGVYGTLDTAQHSLAACLILYTKVRYLPPAININEVLLKKLEEFALKADKEQIQKVPAYFAYLYSRYADCLIGMNVPQRGIYAVREALKKLQVSSTQLTTLHSEFCRICLHAKNLKPALPFLDQFISELSREDGNTFNVKSFLKYFFYGGVIYAVMKNFERALYFFEVAITTPATAPSRIVMDAYKKYVLILLIMDGKLTYSIKAHLLPKQTPQVVSRNIKHYCKVYTELATVFQSGSAADFKQAVEQNTEYLEADNNLGLAKQALVALNRKNLHRLTKIYVNLSLTDVAKEAKLENEEEAIKYIFKMVADGEISAKINQYEGTVKFSDGLPKYNTRKDLKEVHQQILECINTVKKVTELDDEVSVSPAYIAKIHSLHEDDLFGKLASG